MNANVIRRSLVAAAVGIAMGGVGSAHATNGYFAHGYGTTAKGMGGTGMAISQDAYAPGTNPAGIAGMESRFDIGVSYFRPKRSVTLDSPQGSMEVESGNSSFNIPSMGYVRQIDERRSWGIALLGNGGMNTEYPAFATGNPECDMGGGGLFCGGAAGVNLEQLAIIPTYAQKSESGRVSVGFSPIISHQRFSATGLGQFAQMSNDPERVSDNGTDSTWGYGAQVGFQAELSDTVTLGGSYRSKIRNGKFSDYSGLFAGGGSFDIPSTLGLGVSVEATPNLTIAADYLRINYSDIDAISNTMHTHEPLGASGGPGFGWRDIGVFRLGAQYEAGNNWTWRVGYNRGQNPISSDEVMFNIVAPAVTTDHYTFGFTKAFNSNHELNFAAMYAPRNSVSGPIGNGMDATIEMRQYELEIGYAYRF
ncbi:MULTISPECIES: OmpP1/FadL family transporter [unclassified Thioalkalivibrio]|uniref:OmpP1/FadL family transporter n=1 Tax=unclassified Thioalkalivibrio TaxID=2621013 RepID=UPI0003A00B44|nr:MULTISPECIES: outer membrane protein transport protein [unclassified Thioalkalivibrio]